MYRLLWCLPLCLAVEAAPPPPTALPISAATLVAVADDGNALPDSDRLERLARTDPIAFVETCLRRYEREVKGYRVALRKQERIGGKMLPPELLDVQFREEPFSVLLEWREGARLAKRTLYVKGENRDKWLVKPAGLAALIGIVERDPDGPEAKKSGRYPLTEFGIKFGMQRTIAAWSNARKQKALHITYLGIKPIKELGDRPCYVLKRTRYQSPEEDGVTEYTTCIDKETWLQTGSILKGADGQLIAEYYFRDLELNPTFKPKHFTRETLAK
jgi:hypothetical protein